MTRRRSLLALLASLPMLGTVTFTRSIAMADDDTDTLTTSLGELTIHPVRHASLVLTFGDEAIYVDPVGGAALYENLPAPTAILITHAHEDHFDQFTLQAIAGSAPLIVSEQVFKRLPTALKDNATALANGESGEVNGIQVRAIGAYNTTESRLRYHPQGVGNGYVITIGDRQIYVAGDTEPTPDMLGLTDIDVAFLPMNLPFTMTQEQAAEAINTFKPRVAYPYHYSEAKLDVLAAAVGAETQLRIRNWY